MVSLVVPAYNEEHRIERTLRAYADAFGRRLELIVVLNGCRDRTAEVVRDVQSSVQTPIRVLDIREPIGKGGAILEGFRIAHGDLVGFVDADGATEPAEFEKLLAAMQGSVDGVIASRWHPRSIVRNRVSGFRRLLSRILATMVRVLFRMPYTDTQCGAKVFRRRVTDALLPHLKVRDMMFDVELLSLARQRGFTVIEVPTVWVDQGGSTLSSPLTTLRKSFRFFLTILYIRFNKYDE